MGWRYLLVERFGTLAYVYCFWQYVFAKPGTCIAAEKCHPFLLDGSIKFCQKVLKRIPHPKLCLQKISPSWWEFHSPKFLAARMGETTTADPMKAFDGQLETFWADIAGDRAWLGLDFSSQVGKMGRYFGRSIWEPTTREKPTKHVAIRFGFVPKSRVSQYKVSDVQCIRVAFPGIRALQPQSGELQGWNGNTWRPVLSWVISLGSTSVGSYSILRSYDIADIDRQMRVWAQKVTLVFRTLQVRSVEKSPYKGCFTNHWANHRIHSHSARGLGWIVSIILAYLF